MAVTRPSSTRTEQERVDDVSLTWIEEWMRDIYASFIVMHTIIDNAESGSRLLELVVPIQGSLDKVEELIKKVEKL